MRIEDWTTNIHLSSYQRCKLKSIHEVTTNVFNIEFSDTMDICGWGMERRLKPQDTLKSAIRRDESLRYSHSNLKTLVLWLSITTTFAEQLFQSNLNGIYKSLKRVRYSPAKYVTNSLDLTDFSEGFFFRQFNTQLPYAAQAQYHPLSCVLNNL